MEWVLAGALAVVGVLFVYRELHHTHVERDLLNRLMARDLAEYQAATTPRREEPGKRHNIIANNLARQRQDDTS